MTLKRPVREKPPIARLTKRPTPDVLRNLQPNLGFDAAYYDTLEQAAQQSRQGTIDRERQRNAPETVNAETREWQLRAWADGNPITQEDMVLVQYAQSDSKTRRPGCRRPSPPLPTPELGLAAQLASKL